MTHKEDLVYGIHPVLEAFEAGKEVNKVFIRRDLGGEHVGKIKKLCRESTIPFQIVPKEKLDRLTRKNHQGVIASISPVFFTEVENVLPTVYEKGKTPLILILDRVTDVRNFGSICRTAECLGVDAVVVPSRGAALVNGDAVKTSAGALMKLPVCRVDNLKGTITFLRNSGLSVVSCTEKASDLVHEFDYNGPTAIIMGSEEDGVSEAYLKLSDGKVKIPMSGTVDSLNVAVAAGIVLGEVTRQRVIKS